MILYWNWDNNGQSKFLKEWPKYLQLLVRVINHNKSLIIIKMINVQFGSMLRLVHNFQLQRCGGFFLRSLKWVINLVVWSASTLHGLLGSFDVITLSACHMKLSWLITQPIYLAPIRLSDNVYECSEDSQLIGTEEIKTPDLHTWP